MRVVDSEVRRLAVTTDGHAFVWASAGTGKTHTLTLRALYLLLNEADPGLYGDDSGRRLVEASRILQQVALTTFTRKAAAEMRHRLYAYLDLVAGCPDRRALDQVPLATQDPLVAELLDGVLERFHCDWSRLRLGASALAERAFQLQISTIHSFAASVLRRHPLAAGFPASVHFAREDEDDLLGIEELLVDRWWHTRALSDAALHQPLAELLKVVDVWQLRTWLETALRHRWLADEIRSVSPVEPAAGEEALSVVSAIASCLSAASGSKMKRLGSELTQALAAIRDGSPAGWSRLQRACRQHRDYMFLSAPRCPKKLRSFLEALDDQALDWVRHPERLEELAGRSWVFEFESDLWHSWAALIQDFTTWARDATVRELKLVTFDEMMTRAVEMLQGNPRIRRLESRRLKALLVDEFQDTDREQLQLIELLLGDDDVGAQGFFVGDLKQSIYHFRGADVDEIRRFQARFRDSSRLPCNDFQLSATFRTAPTVARFANRFFGDVLELAPPEEHLAPVRDSPTPIPVWWRPAKVEGKTLSRFRARAESANKTVELIRSRCPDPYSYSDVLVLTRTHRELDVLLPELHAADIPTVSSGARTFYRHPEVLDTLNLLIALYSPNDGLATAALLRSPMVQLSDDQIHALLEQIPPGELLHGGDPAPESLPASVLWRIQELRRLVDRRHECSLQVWLHEVSTFIPRTVYVERHDREGRALVRIDRTLEEFQRHAERGRKAPLSWLLRQRQRSSTEHRFNNDFGEDVSLSDETLDAVRVMTIHKAKGLEARLVIVFGWSGTLDEGRSASSPSDGALVERDADGTPIAGFALAWGPVQVVSPRFGEAGRLAARQDRREASRLAYVAATRARDELVLLNPIWSGWRPPENVLRLLDPDDGSSVEWLRLDTALPNGEPATPARREEPDLDRSAYRSHWSGCFEGFRNRLAAGLLTPSGDPGPVSPRPEGHGEGLNVGRLVHAYLEKHLTTPFSRTSLEAVAATLGLASRDQTLDRSQRLLAAFAAGELADSSSTPYRSRIAASRVLGREVPLLLTFEGHPWSGTVDLVLDEGSRVLAVDYKTTRPISPLPRTYQLQRTVYLEGLARVFPDRPVEFEFWWLYGPDSEAAPAAEPTQTELPFG